MVQEQEFHFREWLSSGARGMYSWVTKRTCLPEAFWQHSRAAGREALLALRSLLDAAIEKVEDKPEKRVTKIKVEKNE